MARYWYAYNGVDNPFNPASYEKSAVAFAPICSSGSEICAVYAVGAPGSLSPNNPFTNNVRLYITLALTSQGTPQPEGDQPFVLLKN